MTTYTIRCLCGERSRRFGSRAEMRFWHAAHKRETCTARRSGPARVSHQAARAGRERIVAELVELRAHARTFEPIKIADLAPSPSSAANGWKRVDHDAWGARQADGVRWTGGNCLMSAVANLIGATDITTVPDNSDLAGNPLWLAAYNERLGRIGYRLEEISADRGLASARSWIAVLDDGSSDHAVVARRQFVIFDPAGTLQGGLPAKRVKYGLSLAPTRRVLPVLSLHRGGSMVVPA